MKPTNLMSGSPNLTFSLDDRNATSVQVQVCEDAACATPRTTVAPVLSGEDAYTYDSTAQTRPFYWRARAVYPAGNGPWSNGTVAAP
jgi:hypothetical protein